MFITADTELQIQMKKKTENLVSASQISVLRVSLLSLTFIIIEVNLNISLKLELSIIFRYYKIFVQTVFNESHLAGFILYYFIKKI